MSNPSVMGNYLTDEDCTELAEQLTRKPVFQGCWVCAECDDEVPSRYDNCPNCKHNRYSSRVSATVSKPAKTRTTTTWDTDMETHKGKSK